MSSGDYGDPETRRRILEATSGLLLERGPDLRLREVSDRAGVSRQALYLHFGDRRGLILGLVRHMDETLELDRRLAHVYEADDGAEMLARAMRLNTAFWRQVAPVASVLIASQDSDEALRAAWRDRLAYRQKTLRRVIELLAERGELSEEWSVDDAAALLYGVSHFDAWRELTAEIGWSDERYAEAMGAMLRRALLAG